MSDRSIFREEALEYQSRRALTGDLLRLSPRWATIAFWLLLIAFLGGLVFAAVASIDVRVSRPAELDAENGTLVTSIPARLANEIHRGVPVRFIDESGNSIDIAVTSVHLASGPSAKPVRGGEVTVTIGLDASALGDSTVSSRGTATMVLRERIFVAIVPGLRSITGK